MTASSAAVLPTAPRSGSLVLHQVRKDLAALRWILLGWLALLAGEAYLFVTHGPDLMALKLLLGLVVDMVMVAVVARVMYEDPVAGTGDAFWLTLPLTCRTLLAARLALLAGVVLAPVLLAQMFCLWRLHVPGDRVLPTLLGNLLWETGLVMAYAALAATIRGAARFGGAALLATIGTVVVVATLTGRFAVDVASFARLWPHPYALLGVVATIAAVALCAFYLMRRHEVGAGRRMAALGILVLFWVVASGVIGISDDVRTRWEPRSEETAAWLRQPIVLEKANEDTRRNFERNDPLFRAGTFRFTAPVDDVLLFPSRVKSRVDFGYGRVWNFDSGDRRWFNMDGESPHDMALGLPGAANTLSVSRLITRLPVDFGEEGSPDRTGTLTAEVRLDAYHYEKVAELPLRDGAAAQVDDTGLLVTGTHFTEAGGLIIQVLATRLAGSPRSPDAPTPLDFALKPEGERPPVRLEKRTMDPGARLVVFWPLVAQELHSLVLDAESVHRLGLRDPDSPRFGEARLIVSRAEYVGTTTSEFTVEDFDPREW